MDDNPHDENLQDDVTGSLDYRTTVAYTADRFVEEHGRDVKFCPETGKWFVWNGVRFEANKGEVVERAKETGRTLLREAGAASGGESQELSKGARRALSGNGIRDMLYLAATDKRVRVPAEAFDADPYLLNTLSSTVDLRTGEVRPHRREDLITKLAPVMYDPGAEAPEFEAFLRRILPSEELRRFVQRLFGYYLTADVSEHILAIAHGHGANGKSTLINVILEMMGDYAKQAAMDLLVVRRGAHPTDLADLKGARFVASMEIGDAKRLDEPLVKQLTGGDRLKARLMRQDNFEFEPTHKPLLGTNHMPVIRGTDDGIWRRIRRIPFSVTIPPEERDRKLPDKLREELPGILAWAVRGCLEWQRDGLGEPEEVRAATRAYRAEMDVLTRFIEDECVVAADARVPAQEAFERYRDWCRRTGEEPESQTAFGRKMGERGFESGRITSGPHKGRKEWRGVGLRPSGGDPPDSGPFAD